MRASDLAWVVLRLGGVMTTEQERGMDLAMMHFEHLMPADGRIQTVDVRDVAHAFAAAVTADVVGETLLIGGDATHRLRQADVSRDMTAALGLRDAVPPARRGDPDADETWFATDWMDTDRAQEALRFQHHSWPDLLAEVRRGAGPLRPAMRLVSPLLRLVLARNNARRGDAIIWLGEAA